MTSLSATSRRETDMTTRLCPQVGLLRPASAALAGLLGSWLLLAAPPALAATCGNSIVGSGEACDDGGTVAGDGCSATCTLEANTCIDDVTGKQAPNNCTANDVQLGLIADVQNSDGCDFPGDTAQVKLQAGLRATSANRWDIGIFVALDGGTARTGACHHNYLPPPLAGLGSYNPGSTGVGNGPGPFLTDDGDTCGDLKQGVDTFYDLRKYPSFTTGDLQVLTIKCVDNDGNGFVDIGSCVSWDNNSNNPVCSNVSQTVPNTKAKCRCETLNTNLAFPGKILVDKITDPNPDPTNPSFNFSLTGGPDSVNVNFGMTSTTPVFGPGPNNGFFKAGTYTLTETEPAGWDLTSIVCVDADNGTTVNVGAGTATIDLDPGQTITCTYTNRNLCAGKTCDDQNSCTTDTCEAGECVFTPKPGAACGDQSDTDCDNPNTCDANGQCQPNYEPATTVCRASAGVCDVAESCTGNSAACPADGFKAATTECRASAGICDVAESCTGNGAACPADAFKPSTTECRASAGICDVAESCTGSGDE